MRPARHRAGARQAAAARMQTDEARQRATETKLRRAMERWQSKAAAMQPEKGQSFIRHRLRDRARLQAKYRTRVAHRAARRPAEAPASNDLTITDLVAALQPLRSSSLSSDTTSLNEGDDLDCLFAEWSAYYEASELSCSERLPASL